MKIHLIIVLATLNCHGMDFLLNKKKSQKNDSPTKRSSLIQQTEKKEKRKTLLFSKKDSHEKISKVTNPKSSQAIPIPERKNITEDSQYYENLYEKIFSQSEPSTSKNSLSSTPPDDQIKTHHRKKSNSFTLDEEGISNTITNPTKLTRSNSILQRKKKLLDTTRLTKEHKKILSEIKMLEENKKELTQKYNNDLSEIQNELKKCNEDLLTIGLIESAKKKATIKVEAQAASGDNKDNDVDG